MRDTLFIVFEGIDGSGKSTQAKLLRENLTRIGRNILLTSEPSAGPIGTLIRKILQKKGNVSESSMAYLFAADRTDHLYDNESGIALALDSGQDVICDRYVLSSLAYQKPFELAASLNSTFLIPDLTIYLRSDPTSALARKSNDSSIPEKYEHVHKLTSAAREYERAIQHLENKWHVISIDADDVSKEELSHKIFDLVNEGFFEPTKIDLLPLFSEILYEQKSGRGYDVKETFKLIADKASETANTAYIASFIVTKLIDYYRREFTNTMLTNDTFMKQFRTEEDSLLRTMKDVNQNLLNRLHSHTHFSGDHFAHDATQAT
jgi:dTMP kinase